MKLFSLLLICLLSASCLHKIKSDKPVDTKKLTNTVFKGRSAIKGKVSTIEGHIKMITKARSEVVLMPVCEASTDIITQVYKNSEAASRAIEDHPRIDWGELKQFMRVTHTDETGSFVFADVSAGDYYLLSYINIRHKLGSKGGSIMRKLSIENGKITEVSLRL